MMSPKDCHPPNRFLALTIWGGSFILCACLAVTVLYARKSTPARSIECLAVFDVDADVDIVNVEFHARDERVLPLPDVEDSEEDGEE